jgi:hypothetical protein
LKNGGRLLVIGELGSNLPNEQQNAILNHYGTRQLQTGGKFKLDFLPFGQQLKLFAPANVAINLQRVDAGVAIHIIRYDYDSQRDNVPPLHELNLELRLPGNFSSVEVFAPSELPEAECETIADDLHRLRLKNIPLYSIVLLKD